MTECSECKAFFPIEEKYDDHEPGKGDCVHEESDDKGRWLSASPVMGEMEACSRFLPKVQ